jgi:hypothetical protein
MCVGKFIGTSPTIGDKQLPKGGVCKYGAVTLESSKDQPTLTNSKRHRMGDGGGDSHKAMLSMGCKGKHAMLYGAVQNWVEKR